MERGKGEGAFFAPTVVEPQRNEDKDGSPHGKDLGGDVFPLHRKVDGHAHEPVASDAANEDLVPLWDHLLVRHKGDDLTPVWVLIEYAGI